MFQKIWHFVSLLPIWISCFSSSVLARTAQDNLQATVNYSNRKIKWN